MKRLDFVLPDFTRVVWLSDRARETWKPVFERINRAWWDIEWLAVLHGVRSCCLTMVTPEELVGKAGLWVENGLNNLPVAIQGVLNYSYSSTSSAAEPGRPFIFRTVVGRPQHVMDFKRAWDAGDEKTIGELLGYPACCLDFYADSWIRHGLVDTTWPMTKAGLAASEDTLAEVNGPPEANILWRWMGVRAVPHLPCSFDCPRTVEFGEKMIQVGREAGFAQEMDRLMEILSWPVEWSALHGIAEIKTPILKVSTRTDATACKYVVRREGSSYPPEGARGFSFPYIRGGRPSPGAAGGQEVL